MRNIEKIRGLLADDKTDINAIDAKGRSALTIAAEKGHIEIVKLLYGAS
jgi:ankyrin repeat protein